MLLSGNWGDFNGILIFGFLWEEVAVVGQIDYNGEQMGIWRKNEEDIRWKKLR